jgi:hypothetical protein
MGVYESVTQPGKAQIALLYQEGGGDSKSPAALLHQNYEQPRVQHQQHIPPPQQQRQQQHK